MSTWKRLCDSCFGGILRSVNAVFSNFPCLYFECLHPAFAQPYSSRAVPSHLHEHFLYRSTKIIKRKIHPHTIAIAHTRYWHILKTYLCKNSFASAMHLNLLWRKWWSDLCNSCNVVGEKRDSSSSPFQLVTSIMIAPSLKTDRQLL